MNRQYYCPICESHVTIRHPDDPRSLFGRLVQCQSCEAQLEVGTDEHGLIGLVWSVVEEAHWSNSF